METAVSVENCTCAVVQITGEGYGVLGIVGQVVVHGVELDLHIGRVDRAAVAIGLAHIIIHGLKDHFACGIVGC